MSRKLLGTYYMFVTLVSFYGAIELLDPLRVRARATVSVNKKSSIKKGCTKHPFYFYLKKFEPNLDMNTKVLKTFSLVQKSNIIYSFLFFVILKGYFSIFDFLFHWNPSHFCEYSCLK